MASADLILRLKADAAQAVSEVNKVGAAAAGVAARLAEVGTASSALGGIGDKTIPGRKGMAELNTESGKAASGLNTVAVAAEQTHTKMSAMSKMMIAAFSVAAVKQVLDFGAAMFKVGLESQAFGRKFQAVFGDNETLLAWADAHHQAFGVAADEVQGYLAQVGNLLTGMGLTADEAGAQATEVLELAGAWSAWSGGVISVSDAADKLTRGMMGQTRGLMELGLKVTEEEVAARLAAAGLDQLTGVEASRAQQQIMWQLIQEKSTTAVGAYGEAMGGAYGASMTLATAIDEIKDSIGEMVVAAAPAIELLADIMGLVAGQGWQMEWKSGEMTAQVAAQMAQIDKLDARVRQLGGTYQDVAGVVTYEHERWLAAEAAGDRAAQNLWAGMEWSIAANRLAIAEDAAGLLDASGNRIASSLQAAVEERANAERILADAYAYTAVQVMDLWAAEQTLADLRLAALDPVFAAIQAEQGLADATAEKLRLEAAGLTGTDEYTEALYDQLAAQARLDEAHGRLSAGETQARLAVVALGEKLNWTSEQMETAIGYIEDFNTEPLTTDNAQAAVDDLALSLGLSETAALDLALALGLIDGQTYSFLLTGVYVPPTGGPSDIWEFPPKALGGPVSPYQTYIVGEDGPELFRPSQAGTIIPNYQMASTAPVTMPTSGGTMVSAPTTVIVQGSVWALDELAAEIEARLVRSAQRGGSSLLLAGG